MKEKKLAPIFEYDPPDNFLCTPEELLLIAVIKNAIADYLFIYENIYFTDSELREGNRANKWLFEEREDDKEWPWTFNWICCQLEELNHVTNIKSIILSHVAMRRDEIIEHQLAA